MYDFDLHGRENDNDKDDIVGGQSVIDGIKKRPRLYTSNSYNPEFDGLDIDTSSSKNGGLYANTSLQNLAPKNTIQEQFTKTVQSGIHYQENNGYNTTKTKNQNTTGEWDNYQEPTNLYLGDPHSPERRVMSKGMEKGIRQGAKGFLTRGYVGAVSGFTGGLVDGMTTEYLTQKFSE